MEGDDKSSMATEFHAIDSSSSGSDKPAWTELVPKSWTSTQGRWSKKPKSRMKTLPRSGENSPGAFFDFEKMSYDEPEYAVEMLYGGPVRFEISQNVSVDSMVDESVQATAWMAHAATQTSEMVGDEGLRGERDQVTHLSNNEVAGEKEHEVAGEKEHEDQEYDEFGVKWIAPGQADYLDDEPVIAQEALADKDVFVDDGMYCKFMGPFMLPNDGNSGQSGVKDENGFRHIEHGVTSDSGAADTVGPVDLATDYPLEESWGSKHNIWYVGAGGHKIKNLGQRRILVMTEDKLLRWMTLQVAKVKKILSSVSKNNDAGQEVVYKKTGSYIMDAQSGEKLHLTRQRGTFKFEGWVVPYWMVKAGNITFKDKDGTSRTVTANSGVGFNRQG